MTIEQFGQSIKQKNPSYSSIPDSELGRKMLEKYPQYKSVVDTQSDGGLASTVGKFILGPFMPSKTGIDIATGIVKSIPETIGNTLQMPTKIGEAITGKQSPATPFGPKAVGQTALDIAKASNQTQETGKTIGAIGQFMIPLGGEESAVSKAPALMKLLSKAGTSALEFGGKELFMSGDLNKAATSAIIGAFSPGIDLVAGGVKKALTDILPEKLYAQIFKRTEDDLAAYYKSAAKGGEINPTLAREMIDRSVFGSSKNMAIYSSKKLNELEKAVDTAVQAKKLTGQNISVKSDENAFIGMLDTIKNQFKSGFFSPRAKQASDLIAELKSAKTGDISVETTLKLRRFFDNMRNTSSFRMDPSLSPRQEEFKVAADSLRKKLSDAGLGDLMNEERIYIQAFDSIVSDATKRQNRQMLGMTDALIGGGGLASGLPGMGFGAEAAYRGFQQPFTLTGLGTALDKTGKFLDKAAPITKKATKVIAPVILNNKNQ